MARTARVDAPQLALRPREAGQSLVELALTAPVLIALILSVVEAGNAYNSYVAIVSAAREGARLAARGNIFRPDQVLLVVQSHTTSVNLAGSGSVILTSVVSQPAGFTSYTSQQLLGSHASKFNASSLSTTYQQAIASNPSYLGEESFVILEIYYVYRPITGFTLITLPMYAYSVMPVSAPS